MNDENLQEATDTIEDVITQDFTSLKQHDHQYHNDNYTGGPCIIRDQMESGDNSDEALNEAEKREESYYAALRYEQLYVERAVFDKFKSINARNSRILFSDPDRKGESKLTIWSNPKQVGPEAIKEDELRSLMSDLGYDMLDYAVMVEADQKLDVAANKRGRPGKPKQCFMADVKKRNPITIAKSNASNEVGYVHRESTGDLSEQRKNELLKRYGVKSVGGKIMQRDADEIRRERAKRYLGIVGDFEGQSNREDVASGEWERRRLEALKREQEARAAYQRELGIVPV